MENQSCRGIIIYNNGKSKGTPGWIQYKENGNVISEECANEKKRKGIMRVYNNHKNENKAIKPGWLIAIIKTKGKEGM